jgi:putative membrane protein
MLSAEDHARITQAVGEAEDGTSGEIVCVLASEVSHYPEVALGWAAISAVVLPPLALALGVHPLALAADTAGEWVAAQAGALERDLTLALGLYALVQTALFALVFAVFEIPAVRRLATPAALKRHKVERAARQQFAAIAARAHGSETGVLIFVALVDRQVRVLADKALHDKSDDAAWKAAATAIAEGMKAGKDPTTGIVQAVSICGAVLKARFPAPARKGNVFSNTPVEI